jgi:hypothetical protein
MVPEMISLSDEFMNAIQELTETDFKKDHSKSSIIKSTDNISIKMSNHTEYDGGLIPDYDIKEEPLIPDVKKDNVIRVSKKNNMMFILGAVAVGCVLLFVIFMMMRKKGSPKASGGPTIVEVTELEGSKTKASVNNRQSSPRIIFGDLRKNPSLIVAPMVTPKK